MPTTGPNVRPGEKPPVLPPVGRTRGNVGAVTFAAFWFQALDWGYATTSSGLAKDLFVSSCRECRRFVNFFDQASERNDHFKGGRLTITAGNLATDRSEVNATAVDVVFAQDAVTQVDSRDNVVSKGASSARTVYRVWLRWVGEWTVIDLKEVVSR